MNIRSVTVFSFLDTDDRQEEIIMKYVYGLDESICSSINKNIERNYFDPERDFTDQVTGNEQKSYWIGKKNIETISLDSNEHSLMFCLTLYNESSDMLRNTLESIVCNAEFLYSCKPKYKDILVCIISDGVDRISESTMQFINNYGIYRKDELLKEGEDGLHIVDSTIASSLFIQNPDNFQPGQKDHINLRVLFCAKGKNRGKLDSHWWFFNVLCKYMNPDYCFQIDAGTILHDDALTRMCQTFERSSSVSAVASTVLIESNNSTDLLESFQCGDFFVQKSIFWTAERFFGYMSVIPGQFCGVSFEALSHTNKHSAASPLDRYFKGINSEIPFEKIKYMAEDRIMGFELLVHKGSDNRLDYSHTAIAYTDKCDSMDELLKQRRRWINSAFMCRMWMLMNLGRYFKDSASSLAEKTHTCMSFFYMICIHIIEWFIPLFNILIMARVFSRLNTFSQKGVYGNLVLYFLCALITIAWFGPTVLALSGQLNKWSNRKMQILMCLTSISTVFALVLTSGFSFLSQGVLFFLLVTTGPLVSSLILGKTTLKRGLKSVLQFILIAPQFNNLLYSYAFLNIDNSSWGTKGLTSETKKLSKEKLHLSKSSNRFRNIFVSCWLTTNLGIAALVISKGYAVPVLQSCAVILSGIFIFGIIGALVLKFR